MVSKIVKIALIILVGLIGLLLLGIVVALLIYPAEYVRRVFVWQNSDYGDYMEHFHHSWLRAPAETFAFEESLNEELVAAQFEQILEVDDFERFLEETQTQAFLVIQDDAILYEHYANGAERETLLTSFSVAKSLASTLVGIALAEGAIGSVDDPITDYLPELLERDPRFADINVGHLLLMASGMDYQEMRWGLLNGDDPITTYYPDQRQAALNFVEIVDLPGEYFQYNKYHPQLLGMILERATGVSVTEYTQEKLWEAMETEFDGSWSIDSPESDFEKMEAGFNARAIDFAKFGRLYLRQGDWNGEQVVPAQWVTESTQVEPNSRPSGYYQTPFGQHIHEDLGGEYGYMWYSYPRSGSAADFAGEGDRGQILYVSPQHDLIIVRHGLEYGIPLSQWITTFYDFAGIVETE